MVRLDMALAHAAEDASSAAGLAAAKSRRSDGVSSAVVWPLINVFGQCKPSTNVICKAYFVTCCQVRAIYSIRWLECRPLRDSDVATPEERQ